MHATGAGIAFETLTCPYGNGSAACVSHWVVSVYVRCDLCTASPAARWMPGQGRPWLPYFAVPVSARPLSPVAATYQHCASCATLGSTVDMYSRWPTALYCRDLESDALEDLLANC